MNVIIMRTLLVFLLGIGATASAEGFFDGKTPLLCSIHQLFECDPPNACIAVGPDDIQGPSHLNIDFKAKVVTQAGEESGRKSDIKSVTDGPRRKIDPPRRRGWCPRHA